VGALVVAIVGSVGAAPHSRGKRGAT